MQRRVAALEERVAGRVRISNQETGSATNDLRPTPGSQRNARSRSNTAHSYSDRLAVHDEPPVPELPRPSIRSVGRVNTTTNDRLDLPREKPESPESPNRPTWGRAQTFEGPRSLGRSRSGTPLNGMRKTTVPEDPGMLRAQLRPSNRANTGGNLFGDPSDASTADSNSPDQSYRGRSVSPATSHDSLASKYAAQSTATATPTSTRKGPPPPPPTRTKKPPPPPPIKRADVSSASMNRY